MLRLGCVLLVFLGTACSAASGGVVDMDFRSHAGGVPRGWQKASSAGTALVQPGRGGSVLRIESRDKAGFFVYRIPGALGPGTLKLRVCARWRTGPGQVWFRVQRKLNTAVHSEADVAKLEYRHDASWPWRFCWTRYYDGDRSPVPQPISDPGEWSTAECTSRIESPIADAVLVIHIRPTGTSPLCLEVAAIQADIEPEARVEARLRQTCWTTGPIGLVVSANPRVEAESAKIRCILTDKMGKVVWEEGVRIGKELPIAQVAIPAPPAGAAITEYRLQVQEMSPEGKPRRKVGQWDLWRPPASILEKRRPTPPAVARVKEPGAAGLTCFTYWSEELPFPRSQIKPPANWREQRESAPRIPDHYWSADQRRLGYCVYEPRLSDSVTYCHVPSRFEQAGSPMPVFPGRRGTKLLGIHALRPLERLDVQIDAEGLASWLRRRVQVRQLIFVPAKTGTDQYQYQPGPFVTPEPTGIEAGASGYYAVILDVPPDLSAGTIEIPLRITQAGHSQSHRLMFHVVPRALPAPPWHFALYAGPFGNEAERGKRYADMRAMGMDTVILYNVPPCDLAYREGQLVIDFGRYEKELRLLREADLLDNGPLVIGGLPQVEAALTQLSSALMKDPGLKDWPVKFSNPDIAPNQSLMEERLFLQVLQAIQARRKSPVWPKEIWLQPQDEIDWKFRIEQTDRFGRLIKTQGFPVVVTSDGIRFGFDGPRRLDRIVDHRMYCYLNEAIIRQTRAEGDSVQLYNVGPDSIFWAYYPWKINPVLIPYWSYIWPVGSGDVYDVNGGGNSGPNVGWPGAGGPLPSLLTFEATQSVVDASLLRQCYQAVDANPRATVLAACLKRIQAEIPTDTWILSRNIDDGALPKGNIDAWREILLAALDLATE